MNKNIIPLLTGILIGLAIVSMFAMSNANEQSEIEQQQLEAQEIIDFAEEDSTEEQQSQEEQEQNEEEKIAKDEKKRQTLVTVDKVEYEPLSISSGGPIYEYGNKYHITVFDSNTKTSYRITITPEHFSEFGIREGHEVSIPTRWLENGIDEPYIGI